MTDAEKTARDEAAEVKFNNLYWSALSGDLHEVAKMKFVFGDGFKAGANWRDAQAKNEGDLATAAYMIGFERGRDSNAKEYPSGYETKPNGTIHTSSGTNNASEASAEFSEVECIALSIDETKQGERAPSAYRKGYRKGFEKGRASTSEKRYLKPNHWRDKAMDLEAKLASAEQIIKINEWAANNGARKIKELEAEIEQLKAKS